MEFKSSSCRVIGLTLALLVFMFDFLGRSEATRRDTNNAPGVKTKDENQRKNKTQYLEFPDMPNPCRGPRRQTEMKDYLCRVGMLSLFYSKILHHTVARRRDSVKQAF